MRHGIAGNRLGRNAGWRKATVRDIAKATLVRQRICTTKAKAKEARKLVDQLITLGKKGELIHRRRAFAILGNHRLVSELFRKTAPRFKQRAGGYTRIIPLSLRRGDNAQLAYLELTEKEEIVISKSRSSATAKTKELDVSPQKKHPSQPQKKETLDIKDEKESTSPQQPQSKPAAKKHTHPQDKGKSYKKFVGGVKKIFRRKTVD